MWACLFEIGWYVVLLFIVSLSVCLSLHMQGGTFDLVTFVLKMGSMIALLGIVRQNFCVLEYKYCIFT